MSKIILIRHGESLGNTEDRFYLLPDAANILSKKGVDQCIQLSNTIEALMEPDFHGTHTTVLTSAYQRAKLTAQIVMSKTNHRLIEDKKLNEISHIVFSKSIESPEECIVRMQKLLDQHEFNLVCFTHGLFMQALDDSKPRARNCEVRVYDRDDFEDMLARRLKKIYVPGRN